MTPTTTFNPEQQRMDALASANEIRLARASLKRQIRAGQKSVRVVVLDPPWYVDQMYLVDLVMAMPRYGQARAGKLLRKADLSFAKRIGAMTDRQRRIFAEVLP